MKTKAFLAALAFGVAFSGFALQTNAPPNTGSSRWFGITSSADGRQLLAACSALFISTNYGSMWAKAAEAPTNGNWGSCGVASSATGVILAGADLSSGIWLSHDSGATWNIQNLPTAGGWTAVAMSKDGNRIIAVAAFEQNGFIGGTPPGPGLIYLSSNSGATWLTNSLPAHNWILAASSADGRVIAAAAHIYNFNISTFSYSDLPGPFFTSTNYGSTWFSNNIPLEKWSSITCSLNGRQWLAGTVSGLIYSSKNYGVAWDSNNPSNETNSCTCVAVSADGTKWLAAYSDGKILFSTNQGAVWSEETYPNKSWICITMSADGDRWAGVTGDNIYTSYSTPNPYLNLSSTTNKVAILSWIISSTNFVLQQSFDLAHWLGVTNPPVLNLTNLQNQVTQPTSAGNSFFRLKTP